MKPESQWRLIALWAAASAIWTFVLWVPLAAAAGAVTSPLGLAATPFAMLLYGLYSPVLAPLIVVMTLPTYMAMFWLWARVCRRHPGVDSSWKSIVVAAAGCSLPPAVVTALLCGRGPYSEVTVWLPFCVAMFWGAIALPRWLLESLHPGAFQQMSAKDV